MTKILRPYTIIPSDLYVQREADRQIENIIKDMGRPGYVLVSRQMGKTNLLLNAKRRLESPDDLFLYVDLSNPFDTAKSCFENIIDTALEVDEVKFELAAKQIASKRNEQKILPPHKQHTNELRILLSSIQGNLVIILDEIDALTKTTYSDLIFAQIRSIYFSRVNYPELNRLTYILSGVMEPIEIIKDPKISPFNIGQKIYLNDFSRKEFEGFTRISNLTIDPEIADRIFFWAKGNPRMTWDICSEYEVLCENNRPSIQLIDQIVRDIYLTTFDKPPIDNIRELVKNDRDIRNAIVEIIYNKGNEVSDKIRSKLYLSGIINFSDQSISIKNEIIKEALNIEWIKAVESEEKGLLRIAVEFFEKGNFKACIQSFEEYIKGENVDDEELATLYFYFGEAYFRDNQLDMALTYLDKAELDIDDQAKLYYRRLNLKGTILYRLDRIDESLEALKQIIDSGRKDIEFAQALINYGVTLMKSPEASQLEEAVRIFEAIINESALKNDRLKKDFIIELKAISHKSLAGIQARQGAIEPARANFEKSLSLSPANSQPSVLLSLYDFEKDIFKKEEIIRRVIDVIITNNLVPVKSEIESPNLFSFNDFRKLIFIAFSYHSKGAFPGIINVINRVNEENGASIVLETLFSLLPGVNDPIAFQTSIPVLYSLVKSHEIKSDSETEFKVTKFFAFLNAKKPNASGVDDYYRLFRELEIDTIDVIDLTLFENRLKKLVSKNEYAAALTDLAFLESSKRAIHEPHVLSYWFMFNNIELLIHSSMGNARLAQSIAVKTTIMGKDTILLSHGENRFGEDNIRIILENARFASSAALKAAVARFYKRNEKVTVRYKTGEERILKYKVVEKDINMGLCTILN